MPHPTPIRPRSAPSWALLALSLLGACAGGADEPEPAPEDSTSGLITTLVLTFTPTGGGEALSFQWTDPEGDGDADVDSILLPDGSEHSHHHEQGYALEVEVWDDGQEPARDVTLDVRDAADEHQLFFTGSAVEGPGTGQNDGAIVAHDYDDTDSGGLPLGLVNSVSTRAWGAGELTVTLRHLPPGEDQPTKVEGIAADVAEGGFDAIPGSNEIQVTFEIDVE